MKKIFILIITLMTFQAKAQVAAEDLNGIRAIGSPANPKVKAYWNKYSDHAEIYRICSELAKAYPDLVKIQSIGKSVEGRDIWLMSITDYKTGVADRKPGFYIWMFPSM